MGSPRKGVDRPVRGLDARLYLPDCLVSTMQARPGASEPAAADWRVRASAGAAGQSPAGFGKPAGNAF